MQSRSIVKLISHDVISLKCFSTSHAYSEELSYKLVVLGGGTGGATMAARLSRKVGRKNILVIEPSDTHYYQPYWTLVGGGLKDVKTSGRPMSSVLPKSVTWLKDKVVAFNPSENTIETDKGKKVKYDFLVVALGIRLGFEKIEGLPEAFETPGVCSNYSVHTVQKTTAALHSFKEGNAIFTQPPAPIKCAGAPQKIAYLTEDYFRKSGKRKKADISFYTAMGSIFTAPKYAAALVKVAESKGIAVNYQHNLVAIRPDIKEAVFEKLGDADKPKVAIKYEMLHITPPMFPPEALEKSPLADSTGYLDVDKFTLQHKKYPNVFGIGDCTNVPTSKTAAAVAAQCGVLTQNMISAMEGRPLKAMYNGYTSCPLVTGNEKGILAEFDFDLKPVETLPIDQGQERYISYLLKKDLMPFLYWNLMLKGHWKGPKVVRKILRLGMAS